MKTLHKPQADTALSFPRTHFQDSLFALALPHHVEDVVSATWQIWGTIELTFKAWHRLSHTWLHFPMCLSLALLLSKCVKEGDDVNTEMLRTAWTPAQQRLSCFLGEFISLPLTCVHMQKSGNPTVSKHPAPASCRQFDRNVVRNSCFDNMEKWGWGCSSISRVFV